MLAVHQPTLANLRKNCRQRQDERDNIHCAKGQHLATAHGKRTGALLKAVRPCIVLGLTSQIERSGWLAASDSTPEETSAFLYSLPSQVGQEAAWPAHCA